MQASKHAAPRWYDAAAALTESRMIECCCTGEKGTKELGAMPELQAIAGRSKMAMRPASNQSQTNLAGI
jgi:hypothetical protein